jgi:hypothetical protein
MTPITADRLLRELTLYVNESEISSGIKAEWSAAIAQARAALAAHDAQPDSEPVALLWRCLKALKLAGAMCDRVPHRAHTAEPDGALRDLGVMVNKQNDGSHGYRVIYDALEDLGKYLTTPTAQPAAEPTQEMVTAYLTANDAYWHRVDEAPTKIGKWRDGTPREATLVSLRSALAVAPRAQPAAKPAAWAMHDKHGDLVYAGVTYERSPDLVLDCDLRHPDNAPHVQTPLYTHPAQPSAECKAGGPCRWRGNASAEFLAAHDAQQQEPIDALDLAIMFHHTYERLAPSVGYDTRVETRVFDPESPNGKLMLAVCAELLPKLRAGVAPAAQKQEPFAHICVITTDAGPTKFFTAPSDPRGFPVYTHPAAQQQEPQESTP